MRFSEIIEDINQPFQSYDEMKYEEWRSDDDCSIVALAVTTGLDYETVRNALMKNSYMQKNVGYSKITLTKTITDLGFEYSFINPDYYVKKINEIAPSNEIKILRASLLKFFPEAFSDEINTQNQIWSVHNHAMACKNGKIEGQISNDQITFIMDIFKPGQKPERDDSATYNNDIINYDESVDKYMEIINTIALKRYHVDRNQADEFLQQIIDRATKYEIFNGEFDIDKKFTGGKQAVIKFKLDQNKVILSYEIE